MKILTCIVVLAFVLLSCGTKKKADKGNEPVATAEQQMNSVDMHNARNSLDWAGTYRRILPCADCNGIETEVIVNEDGTFVKRERYLGKEGTPIENKGNFRWDDTGSVIILEGLKNGPFKYFVAENALIPFDTDGNRLTGELKETYALKKIDI